MADLSGIAFLAVIVGGVFTILIGMAALVKAFYFKVEQGTALIVNDLSSTPKVHFTGAMVLPIIYKKELMKVLKNVAFHLPKNVRQFRRNTSQ